MTELAGFSPLLQDVLKLFLSRQQSTEWQIAETDAR
jgi:hypothetical protein